MLGAQCLDLRFEFGNTGLERLHGFGDLPRSEAWGDVLRAVPIVGIDVDQEESFGALFHRWLGETRRELRFIGGAEYSRATEDFEPTARGIIHQEERDTIVMTDIARREELSVATIIGEADLCRAEHLEESSRAAAMLQVGPTGFVGRRHVERVTHGDKLDFLGPQIIGSVRDGGAGFLMTTEELILSVLHLGGEHLLQVFLAHERK